MTGEMIAKEGQIPEKPLQMGIPALLLVPGVLFKGRYQQQTDQCRRGAGARW